MEPDDAHVATSSVGEPVGPCVVGALVSPGLDGARVGASVGAVVGASVGATVVGAAEVGVLEGGNVGVASVGLMVGTGASVSLLVTQFATNPAAT